MATINGTGRIRVRSSTPDGYYEGGVRVPIPDGYYEGGEQTSLPAEISAVTVGFGNFAVLSLADLEFEYIDGLEGTNLENSLI